MVFSAASTPNCCLMDLLGCFIVELTSLFQWSGQPADAVETLIDKAGLSSTALEQLELYTWWRPSAWYRVGLEILHTHGSLSWLASIICGLFFFL